MSLIWTQANLEPKRKFRYLITFTGFPDVQFLAQTCDRPGIKVGVSEHKYFDKTYHHPGKVTFDPNPLSIKLVDIQRSGGSTTDTNESLLMIFANSGLNGLIGSLGEVRTVGKEQAVNSLGQTNIRVLESLTTGVPGEAIPAFPNGIAEEWTLKNAWLESFKPDSLDYGAEDILTVTIQVRYDWAEFKAGHLGPSVNPFGSTGQL
jgi:hypothetical protein